MTDFICHFSLQFSVYVAMIRQICSVRPQDIVTTRSNDLFICVEVLRPSQPNGVMSSAVSLPNHTFTGQAWSSRRLTSIVHILSPETDNCPSWISGRERMRSNDLLVRLDIEDLDLILKERRLRWYGHVEHSSGAVKTAFDIQVDGKHGPGRPKMTWKQLTERDCREWKLSAINLHDRHTWRSGVRSAIHAASQLSGRGPTGVDVAPVPAR